MKYISFDLETTCLGPKEPKNILGVAAVLEDSDHPEVPLHELPRFVAVIDPGPLLTGSLYALWLNRWILDGIMNSSKNKTGVIYNKDGSRSYPIFLNTRYIKYDMRDVRKRYPYEVVSLMTDEQLATELDIWNKFKLWAVSIGFNLKKDRFNISGKNVGFFDMQFLPEDIQNMFRHRVIDTGSVLVDWKQDRLGSMDDLKKLYLPGSPPVSHDMLEDAWDTISLNRTSYPKPMTPLPVDKSLLEQLPPDEGQK